MRTSNPALSDKAFQMAIDYGSPVAASSMTLQGTVIKTAILLGTAVIAAAFSWNQLVNGADNAKLLMIGGAIGGFVASLVVIFKPTTAPWAAPLYAVCEGLFLGAISAMYESAYNGIVVQAALLTAGTLGALLLAYTTRIIKATENFKLGVTAATGGICLFYAAAWLLRMFGIEMPFLHDHGLIGIGISLFIVLIAALNLVLDFDFIEQGEANKAPKHMEWYAAFGLLVTLVWLYLETLRLLAKLQSRD